MQSQRAGGEAMHEPADSRERRVHSTDEADVAAYQAVSKAAILAFVCGLGAAGALLHPLLLVVPLVAVGAGIFALRSIAVSTAGLTGRRLAVAGAALGVLFASAAAARLVSRDLIIASRGQRFANAWVGLAAAGRREAAYEMTLPPARRQLPGTDLAEFYQSSAESNEELQQFFATSPTKELVEFGSQGTLRLEEVLDVARSSFYGDVVAMIYVLEYVESGQPKTARIHLVARRSSHKRTGQGQWRIEHVGLPEKAE
jgi:hypothetical protein